VQSSAKAGNIVLKASVEGMPTNEIVIKSK